MSKLHTCQLFFTALGAWLGAFLGGLDGFLYTLIIFVVVDYITGVMVAITERNLSSETGFKGIFKKVIIFLLVGIGNLIDVNVLGQGATVRTAVVFFYLSNEGISIMENAGKLGLPIPEKLRRILEQLKDDEDENNIEDTADIYFDDCFSEEPIEEDESDDI